MDLHHLKVRSDIKMLGDLLTVNHHVWCTLICFYTPFLRSDMCECLREVSSRRQGEQWGVERETMIIMRQLQNLVFITFLNNSPPFNAKKRKTENSVRGTQIP